MDVAHKETDKMIEELDKELSKVYSQATKEIEAKADVYFQKFKTKDEIKQQQLANGVITKDQYKTWRKNQLLVGDRWNEMKETLAEDLTHTNQIAADIINGKKPAAYALNHNYGTFLAEKDSKVGTSYVLYDKDTVERLVVKNPDLLPKTKVDIPKDKAWNKKKITSAITQGVLQGESIPDLSKRLRSVTDMNYRSSIRNARTAMTSAQNAGRTDAFTRAKSKGIEMLQVWCSTLDNRTRHSHVLEHGEKIPVGGKFSNGLRFPGDPTGPGYEVYNCRCTLLAQVKGIDLDVEGLVNQKTGVQFSKWLGDQAAPDSAITSVWAGMKMSNIYNLIKAQNTKDANTFYKELGKLGKPSEVWDKYLTGQLDADELAKFEGILKKYLPKKGPDFDNPYSHTSIVTSPKFKDGTEVKDYLLTVPQVKNYKLSWYSYVKKWANGDITDSKLDELLLGIKKADKIDDIHDAAKAATKDIKITKGKMMTKDEADDYKVNPFYNKYDTATVTNCQTSSYAYECRRQGYDVVAIGRYDGVDEFKDIVEKQNALGNDQRLGWINKKTGGHPTNIIHHLPDQDIDTDDLYKVLSQKVGVEDERYIMSAVYPDGKRHSINIERDSNGVLRIVDNQRGPLEKNTWTGSEEVKDYLSKVKNINSLYRVDDCVPDSQYFNKILADASKVKNIANDGYTANSFAITTHVQDIGSKSGANAYFNKWRYGLIDDDYLDNLFGITSKATTAKIDGAIDINILKTKKVTQVYNEIKDDIGSKDANAFYNELKNIGKKDNLKQGDVWKKYLAGELDADDVAKIEKYLDKYKVADLPDWVTDKNFDLIDPMTGEVLDKAKEFEKIKKMPITDLDDMAKQLTKDYYDLSMDDAKELLKKSGLNIPEKKVTTKADEVFDKAYSDFNKKDWSHIYDDLFEIDPDIADDMNLELIGIKKNYGLDKKEDVFKAYFNGNISDADKAGMDELFKKYYDAKNPTSASATPVDKTTLPKSMGAMDDDMFNDLADLLNKKGVDDNTSYYKKWLNGKIDDEDLDKFFGISTPKPAEPEIDFDAIKDKKMSAVYNEIKATDTKTANQFYNELKKMGKPSEVWDDYVNGAISAENQKKIEDLLIKKYNKGGINTPATPGAPHITSQSPLSVDVDDVEDLAKLAKSNKDLYDDAFDILKSEKGSPSTNWKKYLAGEIDNPELDKILVKHNLATDEIIEKVEKHKKLEIAQEELEKAEEALAKISNKTYSGIWKDDVTLANYEVKKGTIKAKKIYYEDTIKDLEWLQSIGKDLSPKQLTNLNNAKKYLIDLEEYEKLGKEYAKYQKAVEDARGKVAKLTPVGEAYTQERKDKAKWYTSKSYSSGDKYYSNLSATKNAHKNATPSEHKAYYEYTSASGGFNRPLTGFDAPKYSGGSGWDPKYYKGPGKVDIDNEGKGTHTRNLTTMIEKSKMEDDIWIQTAQNFETLEGPGGKGFLPGINYGDLKKMTDTELQKFVGVEAEFPQFISGSINRGGGSYTPGNVRINIYCPKGSEALYVLSDGAFGKAEHEIILQRGGTYRVSKIYWGQDVEKGGKKLMVDLELRLDKGYDKFQQ